MKVFHRFLLALLCIALLSAVLIAAFYAVEDWRGAREWTAAQKEVRLRGGTTDWAAIIPPPIPDDQNLAMAPLFAKALDYHLDPATHQWAFGKHYDDHALGSPPYGTSPSGMSRPISGRNWEDGQPLKLATWQAYYRADPAFPRTPDPQSPAADVLLALSRYSAPLADLAQAAATRPKSRFPIEWYKPFPYAIFDGHALLLQQLAQTLRLRASAELAAGNPGAAAQDIALVFRLSEALQYDSLLIDHLVNITILGMLAQPIWEGLVDRRWNAAELGRLQALLLHEDVLADYAHAVRAEQASAARGLDYMEHHMHGRDIFRALSMVEQTDASISSRLFWVFVSEAPTGWYDQNKARLVLYQQEYAFEAADPQTHRVFPTRLVAGKPARRAAGTGPYTFFLRIEAGIFDDLLPKSARTQTICDQEAIACSLEQYFIDHRAYPDDLSALVPGYLAQVPTDVIDGAPMRYRRTPDGRYLLYSIGWNSQDNGGHVAWKGSKPDYRAGDWVWQYQPVEPPASLKSGK